ncbi:MAG: YkvA family protein [Jaaginema sp. PMC 1078.18]|nr:YkvA family protein [Jaaginema sp. PMC 1078.18]
MKTLKAWVRQLKTEISALYLAARDPRLSWPVKLLAICIVGYALSPIDLIPDFIPVLGYLDDLILLPIGIWLLLKLMPPTLMAEYRSKAQATDHRLLPKTRAVAFVIVGIWFGLGVAIAVLISQSL